MMRMESFSLVKIDKTYEPTDAARLYINPSSYNCIKIDSTQDKTNSKSRKQNPKNF